MKYVPYTLLFVFLSVFAKAQEQAVPSGGAFRYINPWFNVLAPALSTNNNPVISIDSASGMIDIRVTDPDAQATLDIYDLNGDLLYTRPLGIGNNNITLTGISRRIFVFCVQYNGSPLFSMKIVRK
jgi:hypothetical protein